MSYEKFSVDMRISLNTVITLITAFGAGYFFIERIEQKLVDRIVYIIQQKDQIAATTHDAINMRINSTDRAVEKLETITMELRKDHSAIAEKLALRLGELSRRGGTERGVQR